MFYITWVVGVLLAVFFAVSVTNGADKKGYFDEK